MQQLQLKPGAGLSPHTRGKRVALALADFGDGPIPAYAGETLAL